MQRLPVQSPLASGMHELKQHVSEIGRLIPKDAPLLYCDFPIYQNFGDILIMLGTVAFLEDCGNPIADSFSDLAPEKIRLARPRDTVWLLQGGGNFGDLWSSHQNFREQIMRAHPAERVIGLPQTLHYSSPERLKEFARIAGAHKDLHLFWRDRVSYETARRNFDCHNYLCPDMAHYLWPVAPPPIAERKGGDLFLIRRDKEGAAIPEWVLTHQHEFVDWRDLVPAPYKLAYRLGRAIDRLGGATRMRLPTLTVWTRLMRRLMAQMSGTFCSYDRIVTSRLHAHIFACLLGSKTVLIDNSYGKNRTYFDAWTRKLGNVEFATADATDGNHIAERSVV